MSEVLVMPDVIALVRAALLASTAVRAIAGDRIGTSSPADATVGPWIRLHRTGGPRELIFEHAYIQVDCFVPLDTTDSDALADELARKAQAVLFASRNFTDGIGRIDNVESQIGLSSVPDTSRTPPTPRVLFGVIVTVRPAHA